MVTVLALLGALALASIPIALGWRAGASEAEMARVFGLAPEKKGFDPEQWAMQTGTGLTFNQLVFGLLMWALGGFIIGFLLGGRVINGLMFMIGAVLLYVGTLDNRRQAYRTQQAEDMLAVVAHVRTLLTQGASIMDALEDAIRISGPAGKPVLMDLLREIRRAEEARRGEAVRRWSQRWRTVVGDMLASALIVAIEGRVQIADLLMHMHKAIGGQIRVVRHARARAKSAEWYARALAILPAIALVLMTWTAGGSSFTSWVRTPKFLLPALLGSLTSYFLTLGHLRRNLSIESTMGLIPGEEGEIPTDRFGNPL